jgi:uncharacterized membrane protein YgdD (TMEM256/DUF423 family)
MLKNSIRSGCIFAGLAVILGAFGAHALEELLTSNGRLDTYETAVKYQMYHSLGLILIGILYEKWPQKILKSASIAFIVGILFFSGSLYLLCFTGVNKLGMITPLGGVAFIIGWALIILSISKKSDIKS